MSSTAGGQYEGANNEDVAADEATRTEKGRPIEEDDDFGEFEETHKGANGLEDADETPGAAADVGYFPVLNEEALLEQDVPQLPHGATGLGRLVCRGSMRRGMVRCCFGAAQLGHSRCDIATPTSAVLPSSRPTGAGRLVSGRLGEVGRRENL